MRDLAEVAIDTASALGANYADARLVQLKKEVLRTRNEKISLVRHSEDLGFGVRVIADGSWGFACSDRVEKGEVERVAAEAVKIAKASATLKSHDVKLAPERPWIDSWETPIERDPFSVPTEEKIDLLLKINNEMLKVKDVSLAEGLMEFKEKSQYFTSTEGSSVAQKIMTSGAGYSATAVDASDMQIRSYPHSWGQFMSAGYELIGDLGLLENATRVAEEAAMLLKADQCPEKVTDVIIDGSQLCLQIHESLGHPSELDRVLGAEAAFAGTSFLTLDKLGQLQYGSKLVNIMADSTVHRGLATAGYDDEGVPAQKWYIIRNGKFVGYLTSRETAPAIGESPSRGCMRAECWRMLPLIRMTNISLMPGTWTLDKLISDTKDGVYMETNRSWSIDQRRINFQFGTELAWEIKKGKRTRPLKNATYQGKTTEFWNSCDAICDAHHFVLWGLVNCYKGQPGQYAAMSHGAAPARFRKVKIGVAHA